MDVTTQGVNVNNSDNSAILQAIIDGAPAGPLTLYFPQNIKRYLFTKPVFCDRNDLIIKGDGLGSWLYNTSASPLFQLGLKRKSLTPNHWVDLFGILDTSLAPAINKKIGYRTCLDSHIHFSGTALTAGPMVSNLPNFWKTTTQLTIDVGVLNNTVWNADMQQICGAADIHGPAPWYLQVNASGKILAFKFTTNDGVIRRVGWYMDQLASQRISIQLDLTNATVTCWSNGIQLTQMPAPNTSLGADFVPGNSLRLRYDGIGTFGLGSVGAGLFGWGSPVGTPVDLTYFGFRVLTNLVYATANGTQQVRLDGKPINDNMRFWVADPGILFRLQLDDVAGSPLVHGWGTGHSYGFFVSSSLSNFDTISGNVIQDIFLQNALPYGQTVSIGLCYETMIRDCKILNGLHNIGSLVSGVSYPIRIKDTILMSPGECNYFGWGQIVWANGLILKYPNLSAIVLQGCTGHFDNIFITDSPKVEKLIKALNAGGNGGLLEFTNGIADFEGGSPQHYLYVEQHQNTPLTSVVMSSWAFGKLKTGSSHIKLVSVPGVNTLSIAKLSGLSCPKNTVMNLSLPCTVSVDNGWNTSLDATVVVISI